MKLIIGNKNYSSWSLRPWLLLSVFEIAFEEIRIPLMVEGYKKTILQYSDAGKVPVLHDRGQVIWDSLAICEYVSEQYLDGKGWPQDSVMRAQARSCAAEMHSSFFTLRNDMPMNCRAKNRKVQVSLELRDDIARVDSLWSEMLTSYSSMGPWLFGDFSIADCMFAPVVFRFHTYTPGVSEISQEYMTTMLEHPKIQLWLKQAQAEEEIISYAEVGQ